MRRDWNRVGLLLHTIEKLAGHPNLKELRDDALADLKDLAEEPVVAKKPATIDELEAILKEGDENVTIHTDGTVISNESKVSRRSL